MDYKISGALGLPPTTQITIFYWTNPDELHMEALARGGTRKGFPPPGPVSYGLPNKLLEVREPPNSTLANSSSDSQVR